MSNDFAEPLPPANATNSPPHNAETEKSPVTSSSGNAPKYGHRRDPTETSIDGKGSSAEAPTGVAPEPLNIIILGASFGGLSCAHHFLDYTVGRLRISTRSPHYRLIIVSPSTHIFWNIGAPRALVAPGLIKHEDAFIAIEPGFHRHRSRGHDFSIVQGSCVEMDPQTKTVKIECYNFEARKRCSLLLPRRFSNGLDPRAPASTLPQLQTLPYHALLMCTGSSADSDLLSLHGPHLETADALNRFHTQVAQANTIVVCGGGTSGVEVAGQLATWLNHKYHFPIKRKIKDPKQIILITGGDKCLPALPKLSLKAEKLLKKLGVEIKHHVRVSEATEWFDQTGATKIKLSDDTTLVADVYIACTGVKPNSSYVPGYLKDGAGYIQTNRQSIRCDAAGERVYAIGDCASYSQNYVLDVYAAVPVAMHNLLNDLLIHELKLASPYGGNDDRIEELEDEVYPERPIDSQLCPISRFGGVGMLVGLSIPKPMVWGLKGHDYRVCKARNVVIDGGNPYAVAYNVKAGKYE